VPTPLVSGGVGQLFGPASGRYATPRPASPGAGRARCPPLGPSGTSADLGRLPPSRAGLFPEAFKRRRPMSGPGTRGRVV